MRSIESINNKRGILQCKSINNPDYVDGEDYYYYYFYNLQLT